MTQMQPATPRREPDPSLANLSLQISVAFAALSVATFAVAPTIDRVYSVISAILFVFGTIILALGFWNGIQRSKLEVVSLAGLLAVDTSFVPVAIRNRLWLAVVLQIAVSFTFAALRPITEQAFGTLVPTLGIGFATLWGSRFAQFHEREDRR